MNIDEWVPLFVILWFGGMSFWIVWMIYDTHKMVSRIEEWIEEKEMK